ncbi:hypothetical protein MATL_G00222870 [Megalops atlanticus]|uniref:TIR domain-containing protein n=1 Tax=Megalops atlanticus TaxID=7932 RepID=A0A9D3PEP5_MEGAT|nr:hypothetical protein MATL_G00222870 [Megalops atlanticus]
MSTVFLLLVCWLDLLALNSSCHPVHKKDACEVEGQKADCSHMSLREVPSNLPATITSLDVSHNTLTSLDAVILARYPRLIRIDAGYNSISRLQENVCRVLPALRTLSVPHNVVHLLTEKDLLHCSNLTWLNLSKNRLKLHGDPFLPLQRLAVLNVSANGLTSAWLGTQPQLWSLETLSLSGNKISVLRSNDFHYLSNSSLRTLELSSLPIKTFEPGCFKPIRELRDLVMDGTKLDLQLTTKLSQELSMTEIRNLWLRNTQLTSLANATFSGLQATNLTFLDLSRNNMAAAHDSPFRWLRTLETLILETNNFMHLTRTTFVGLEKLKLLNLRTALVKSKKSAYPVIDDFSFEPLVSLETLLMDNATFQEVAPHLFSGLRSLRRLSLGRSRTNLKTVSNATFASLAGSPLRALNLTSMSIARLAAGAFSGLGNLTTLVLDRNFINQTLTGEEFKGLGSVEEIFMSGNKAINLTPWSFRHVPNLRTLTLGRCLVRNLDLDPSPFRPLRNLSTLDLSNNNIANISAGLLQGLLNLRVLRLQHNNLGGAWKSAHPGGPVLFLRGLRSLETLSLDYNGMDEIPTEGLRRLFRLQELSLSGNYLDYLCDSIFDDLGSLRALRLQKNFITSVRREVFGPAFQNLATLRMERNPFDCTCESILWFVDWLATTNTSVPFLDSEYVCNTPPGKFNASISSLDSPSCKDLIWFFVLYVVTHFVVLTFTAITLVFRFEGWRILFYWKVLVSRVLGVKELDPGEARFEYDAYLLYAEKDKKWVERHLLPLEDEQFKFCMEDRDFIPGTSQLESIVDTMKNSRKIVFVVTERLLKDSWCTQYKARQALHQVIEDSRDSVVLILLEDIPDYRLGQTLLIRRGMLKSCCVLHWPVQRGRIPAFRHELQVALGSSNTVQ